MKQFALSVAVVLLAGILAPSQVTLRQTVNATDPPWPCWPYVCVVQTATVDVAPAQVK